MAFSKAGLPEWVRSYSKSGKHGACVSDRRRRSEMRPHKFPPLLKLFRGAEMHHMVVQRLPLDHEPVCGRLSMTLQLKARQPFER